MFEAFQDAAKLESEWVQADYWAKICPNLTVIASDDTSTCKLVQTACSIDVSDEEAREHQRNLIEDGYSLMDNKISMNIVKRLADGATTLRKHGWPATMLVIFHETWIVINKYSKILTKCSHANNKLNYDVLAWFIDSGDSGFSPHRDRQPEDLASSFHETTDGKIAKYVTAWIALTDATPENSCLYVIPATNDPGYYEGDVDSGSDDGSISDPLKRALPNKSDYQNIRCLPRKAGESALFTHRILHWGSKGNSRNTKPRVALSLVVSEDSFERPYISQKNEAGDEDNNIPSFNERLLLACSQLLIYHQRFNLPLFVVRACYKYVKNNQEELEEKYRKKVLFEFVGAMKEALENQGDCDSEEDAEAMLDEMMNAETEGYGDGFEDDFDDEIGQNCNDFDEEQSDQDDNENFDDEEECQDLFNLRETKKRKVEEK